MIRLQEQQKHMKVGANARDCIWNIYAQWIKLQQWKKISSHINEPIIYVSLTSRLKMNDSKSVVGVMVDKHIHVCNNKLLVWKCLAGHYVLGTAQATHTINIIEFQTNICVLVNNKKQNATHLKLNSFFFDSIT